MSTKPLPEAPELARTVIDDLAHSRWAEVSARFDATMRDRLTEDGLAEAWAHIVGLAGTYERHGATDAVRAADFKCSRLMKVMKARLRGSRRLWPGDAGLVR